MFSVRNAWGHVSVIYSIYISGNISNIKFFIKNTKLVTVNFPQSLYCTRRQSNWGSLLKTVTLVKPVFLRALKLPFNRGVLTKGLWHFLRF